MDALKAGAHKVMNKIVFLKSNFDVQVQEAVQGKKVEDHLDTASDPSKKPSERVDAAHKAGQAAHKESEHACKADCATHDHKASDHDHGSHDHKH